MSISVLSIFGTRPECIKMAPVIHALEKHADFESRICVTGQHREMLDQVLPVFGLRPDHDLNLMQPGQDLNKLLARALAGLGTVLRRERPGCVIVQGDTSTCLAGALAAFQEGIPIGHIEAGLRTSNLLAPFPEEANRRLVAQVATFHFVPTPRARDHLLAENIPAEHIFVTGNTVIDALMMTQNLLGPNSRRVEGAKEAEGLLDKCNEFDKLVLVTSHRRETGQERLAVIAAAIAELALKNPSCLFIYPVHPNTAVTATARADLSQFSNVLLANPLDYMAFVALLIRADVILTDSGGIQEETLALGKPILVMRGATERREAVELGTARVVGMDRAAIVTGIDRLLKDEMEYRRMAIAHDTYGNGTASAQIVAHLARELAIKATPSPN